MCGVTVVASYLKAHTASSHGIYVSQTRGVHEVGGGLTTYVVSFPRVLQEVIYPVPGFPAVAHSAGRLRENFMYFHFRYNFEVFQEGTEPLPCCDLCGIHIPSGRLISHRKTE